MIDLLLLPLKLFLITLDLLITVITFGWVRVLLKKLTTGTLKSVPVNEDESHRVATPFRGNLVTTPRAGVFTLYDLTEEAFSRFADTNCMGYREFLGWKTPKIKEFGATNWLTYSQVGKDAHAFGAALRAAGCQPAPYSTNLDKVKTPCRMAIFENTCPEWMVAACGAFSQSITVTTVYATLGIDAVVEAVVDNIIPVIVCNKANIDKLLQQSSKMPSLKYIVYTNDLVGPDKKIEWSKPPRGVTVVSFEDFVASGDVSAYPPTPPKADTCAVVMYTSGSTGKPKGVIVTHRQIVAACGAADIALHIETGKDVYLAYLPLAHIMELMAEFVMITMGCTLCYADPKSLTATGAYPVGALETFKPTLMVAVPKIWDTIKKGIEAKVAAASPVLQFLVSTALEWRGFCLKSLGIDAPVMKILLKKFAKAVGGRLRMGLSGGGPLNGEVQDFCRSAFGITIVQGYGLTETCAGLSIQDFDDTRGGIAGVPIACAEVKLESTPEVGDKAGQPYLSTDRHDVEGNPIFGRGEICVRGAHVTSGYYQMQEKTREEFRDDGWFHTGDIGQFMDDGSLRIVDRKKNLVKLKGGEYVALEKMEMIYGNSTFVDAVAGGICCYGDGDMDRPIALLQLNKVFATKWAKEQGIAFADDWEKLKSSKEVYNAVLTDFKKEHGKSDLSHLEKLVAVSLLDSPWTPENGCLTAANKLQRRTVIEQFEKEFTDVKKKGIF